jgi:hypothetical protein
MAVAGGIVGGLTGGWLGLAVAAPFWGILGGITGRFLTKTLDLWSGFVATMTKAFFGGGCVGCLFSIAIVALLSGLEKSSGKLISADVGIVLLILGPPLGAIAGLVAGVILWLDSGRSDN